MTYSDGAFVSLYKLFNVPTGTEPTIAARTIGGINASDNIADLVFCGVVMLLDHVFDVI